jgi:hypothetical protein
MKKDGQVIDEFGVLTDVEARQLVASLCGVDEMTALRALSGSIAGIPKPKRLHPEGHVFERTVLTSWCGENKEKLSEAAKPPVGHRDSVGKLPHADKVGLTDAFDYGIVFEKSSTTTFRG